MGHSLVICMAILATLPGENAYRNGDQAERQARYGDAVSAFERCAETAGPLVHYAEVRAARARFHGGDHVGALQQLRRVVDTAPAGSWTRFAEFELARLYLTQSEHALAKPLFEGLVPDDLNIWWLEDVRWAAAENQLGLRSEREKGFAFFRDTAARTGWRTKRYDASKILLRSRAPSDKLHAALGLIRAGAPDEAVPILTVANSQTSNVPALHARWRYTRARLYLAQGKRSEGRALLNALADEQIEKDLAHEVFKTLFEEYTRQYEFEAAEKALVRLTSGDKDSTGTSNAHSRLARAYARKSRWTEAIDHYQFVAQHAYRADLMQAAMLDIAHTYRKLGNTSQALGVFESLSQNNSNGSAVIEAGYWHGRLHEEANAPKRAERAYRLAAEKGLTQYYGYRAQEVLAQFGDPAVPAPPPIPQRGGDLLVRPRPMAQLEAISVVEKRGEDSPYQRLRFLGHEGYPEAEWEAIHILLDDSETPDRVYPALGEAGIAYSAMQYASTKRYGQNPDGTQTPERLRVRYPLAYWDIVKSEAAANDLDPYIILSVARQESTYRPALSSSAGAVGIMQLMPSTAKYLADQSPDIDDSERFQLSQPRASIKFGARYLRRMLERNAGNLVYALAAYNAGPGNCDKWQRKFRGYSMPDFVEAIPFTETRNYVKRVLANYATYHSLYSSEN